MKKRNLTFPIALAAGVLLISLAGCSALQTDGSTASSSLQSETANGSTEIEVNSSYTSIHFPQQYSITYEIESPEGRIYTIQKTKDGNGNIYFHSDEEELLFLADGDNYILYRSDENGKFSADDPDALYNDTYVETATEKFMEYAGKSQTQFIPGMESTDEQTISGRDCDVYRIETGAGNFSVTYQFYVDNETGICLGWEEGKEISGYELEADGEVFRCTEFLTENIPSLTSLLEDGEDQSN